MQGCPTGKGRNSSANSSTADAGASGFESLSVHPARSSVRPPTGIARSERGPRASGKRLREASGGSVQMLGLSRILGAIIALHEPSHCKDEFEILVDADAWFITLTEICA